MGSRRLCDNVKEFGEVVVLAPISFDPSRCTEIVGIELDIRYKSDKTDLWLLEARGKYKYIQIELIRMICHAMVIRTCRFDCVIQF